MSEPGRNRTGNKLGKNQLLYQIELQIHVGPFTVVPRTQLQLNLRRLLVYLNPTTSKPSGSFVGRHFTYYHSN